MTCCVVSFHLVSGIFSIRRICPSMRLKVSSSTKSKNRLRRRKSKRLATLRATIQKLSSAAVHQHLKGENFTSFFLMAGRDHMLPDLIWNQQTRTELRSALEAELRDFSRERELAGKSRISWNHSEFEVYYPSLDNEIHIGDHYVRLLFDSSGLGMVRLKSCVIQKVFLSVYTDAFCEKIGRP